MVIVDANVLIFAINEGSPFHSRARRFLEEALQGPEPIGLAWVVLLAFVRVGTLPGFTSPLSIDDACTAVEDWLAAPSAVVLHPTPRHLDVLRGLLLESGTAGNLTSDAHLAALAVEHGARIASFDRDFARFAGVRCFIPG